MCLVSRHAVDSMDADPRESAANELGASRGHLSGSNGESKAASSEPGPSPITNADSNQPSAESQPSSGPRFPLIKSRFTKYGVRVSTIFLVTQGAFLLITIALWVTLAKLVLPSSDVGTEDVEDNHIAVAPPPAYGNTRGSTLILVGFISSELREQYRLAREAREDGPV
ncbi:hypothetical protein BDM02DRAFT_3128021 [Thelephora ganbajun]|uniref:Uncharacterized protein n=1 Tax=Thelephora ganbajun TaxID=370292 RepID=A0ACB6ZJ98_THEGA|nr:hypothetical protein BDM02DRAFT_3128021 [Thelephora ganbajun]